MNLWDRLKILFGADPAKFVSSKEKNDITAASKPDLPIIISSDMLNSIAFSTDLDHFYFVDQDKLLTFSLTNLKGVSIGLINDQLAVVTPNIVPGAPSDNDTEKPDTGIEARPAAGSKSTTKAGRRVVLKLNNTRQYALSYHAPSRQLCIIGAMDIISTLTTTNQKAAANVGCEVHLFSLSSGPVNIIREGNDLIITSSDK